MGNNGHPGLVRIFGYQESLRLDARGRFRIPDELAAALQRQLGRLGESGAARPAAFERLAFYFVPGTGRRIFLYPTPNIDLAVERFDLPVDYDSLAQAGSIMGSGGMIVMDEDTCMVDVAKYFVNFLKFESCGNCTSCRDGLIHMHRLLEKLCAGTAAPDTLERIESLAETIRRTSLCALGTTAVNPVLSTLRHFREEFVAHLEEKRCPAGVCKELITFTIDADKCTGCTLCAKNCPQDAIRGRKKKPHTIEQDKCIKCGICRDVCQYGAVLVK